MASIFEGMKDTKLSMRAFLAELVAMTFFVFTGCGTAVMFSTINSSAFASGAASTVDPDVEIDANTALKDAIFGKLDAVTGDLKINASFGIITALAFGLAITVLVYAIAHLSGGHLNPAVTLALFLNGSCGIVQAIANILAQLIGATLAAGLLYGLVIQPETSSLGANAPSNGYTNGNALLGEIVMTCLLCFVVLQTAVDSRNKVNVSNLAPLAIGFAVFLAHCVLIPIDGCSINPARSFGPALVSGDWADGRFWIFVLGPFVGAIFAVPIYWLLSQEGEIDDHVVANADDDVEGALNSPNVNKTL